MTIPSEAELGTPTAQAGRVATALLVLVGIGIIVGCLSPPRGVDCARYEACSGRGEECVDVPGCGAICIPPEEACQLSCPLPFECAVSDASPPRLRCDGLVPGRAAAEGEATSRPGSTARALHRAATLPMAEAGANASASRGARAQCPPGQKL